MAEKSSGSVSASLIILILVAAVIGAVVAIVLQSAELDSRPLSSGSLP